MKKHFSKILLISFLIILFLIANIKYYTSAVSNELKENIFRLHIIANSDSNEDQELKLKVRDSIISFMKKLEKECETKEDVINIVNSNISNFENIAQKTIKENGFNYDVSIEVGEFYFPTKYYGNISMPAGMYDAIKIEIGDAKGKNWWCSLFPPLCFTDISSGIVDEEANIQLEKNLDNEEYSIITSTSSTYKFKFKLVEILNLKNIL